MKKNVFYYCLIGAIAAAGTSCSSDDEVIETPPPAPVEDPVNHFSEPANTYIVTAEGEYSFDTRKSNGELIPGIESAGWIWATKTLETDTEQELISDVRYEDGKIYFTATGKHGNAVVAAFNANDESVWVWLLWCTDQPETMEFETGAEFLDRAIGATSATPGDKNASGAIVYQFGRNVPIFGGYEEENAEDPAALFSEAKKWTIMNPEYGYEWKTSSTPATIAESMANPTTYYIGHNWQPTVDYTLWEGKTVYDPSPAGYQLPTPDDWGVVINERKITYDEALNGGFYTYNGKSAWFPAGNMGRHFEDGGYMTGMTPSLTYWNGALFVDDEPWYPAPVYWPSRACIYFNPDVMGTGSNMMSNQAFGFAVRCVRTQN